MLATAAIFLMPAAFFPDLGSVPTFEVIILACLVASAPGVTSLISLKKLGADPITAGVLGLQAAVVLSHLSHSSLYYARTGGFAFFKVLVIYLLLVTNIDTPARLRRYLCWIGQLAATLTTLALLQYHNVIDVESLRPLERGDTIGPDGELIPIIQLRGNGFFNDPNDLCLVLLAGVWVSIYRLSDPEAGAARFAWFLPLATFVYAFALTRSRGGFIALIVGLIGLFQARFGTRRALLLGFACLPVLFYAFAGRQTELSIEGGTAQQRIQLWAEGMGLVRQYPLFGVGHDRFSEHLGHDAHNSFVQSYTDLGLFGGTIFLGIFAYAAWTVMRIKGRWARSTGAELSRLHPYVFSILLSYAGGMLSLTRVYVVPTYLVAGLSSVYLRIARRDAPKITPSLGSRMIARLCVVSLIFLIAVHIYIRLFARWG